MTTLEQRLHAETTAEVHFDEISKDVWASDASIFRVRPLGVAIPRSQDDLIKIVQIATDLAIPIIPRGAGTGISGGCLGEGLIVDTSKYLTQILEINIDKGYVVIEPGVILDDLNRALHPLGYRLGPETSTGNRATIGGMAANNASGARSLRYGKMVRHVIELEVVLPGGKKVRLNEMNEMEWEVCIQEESRLGRIVRAVEHIRDCYQEEVQERFPKLDRRVSGYNLDELFHSSAPPNLAKLVVGSEGSFGIISQLKLQITKLPKACGLVILNFLHLAEVFQALPLMLHWEPLSLELLDRKLLHLAAEVPRLKEFMEWMKGEPEAIVIAEFDAETIQEVKLRLSTFEADMRLHNVSYAYALVSEKEKMSQVWEVRKLGLGLLMSRRSYTNAVAFIEDVAVPIAQLGLFMERFFKLLGDKEVGIYGHIGAGCLHIRPYLDLRKSEDYNSLVDLMEKVSSLLIEVGGALSGEHGDGLVRSYLNEKMFGTKIYKAFLELKHAFDPSNLMNPGKIVNGQSIEENRHHLKLNPETQTAKLNTFFDFSREGGFDLAVDMCNGNGLCRKKEKIMCPSFQATGDEYNSTRARANALQMFIHNPLKSSWNDKGLYKVLDLCLQCKGCKTECPSQVDMAKMKAEFLYHYYQNNGLSFREWLMSELASLFKWGYPFAPIFNGCQEKPWFKTLQNYFGIAPERSFPSYAKLRFSKWFETHVKGKQPKGKRVVLFNDTYNEFHSPEIGKSAVQILHTLGYEVIVPPWQCCGRPLISKGRLKEAEYQAKKLCQTLAPFAKAGVPIIGLEPSCILTIIDEYRDFRHLYASAIIEQCQTLDTFLAEHLENGRLPLPLKEMYTPVKVHGHCHAKAIVGMKPTLDVLHGTGFNVEEIPSGCCGMAGSFGYEKEHYELSIKIGELSLLPEVRATSKDTLIIASGLSCRTQISDGTGRTAIHLAEAIARKLDS